MTTTTRTKAHREAPGYYRTDVLDGDGRPYYVSQESWGGEHSSRRSAWVIVDSRNREVSRHASLRDALGSL